MVPPGAARTTRTRRRPGTVSRRHAPSQPLVPRSIVPYPTSSSVGSRMRRASCAGCSPTDCQCVSAIAAHQPVRRALHVGAALLDAVGAPRGAGALGAGGGVAQRGPELVDLELDHLPALTVGG